MRANVVQNYNNNVCGTFKGQPLAFIADSWLLCDQENNPHGMGVVVNEGWRALAYYTQCARLVGVV